MVKNELYNARARIEPQLSELDDLINRITDADKLHNEKNTEQLILNRQYLLSAMIETFCTWNKTGDCLPSEIKLGKLGNKFLELKVVDREQ